MPSRAIQSMYQTSASADKMSPQKTALHERAGPVQYNWPDKGGRQQQPITEYILKLVIWAADVLLVPSLV